MKPESFAIKSKCFVSYLSLVYLQLNFLRNEHSYITMNYQTEC